jgi:hypothetical protein
LPKTGGRRPGSRNKKDAGVQAIIDEAVQSNETPLQHMLAILRDPQETKERRFDAAKAAAGFVHPRALVLAAGEDGLPIGVGEPAVHIWLPSNGRDRGLELALGDFTAEELAEHEAAEKRRLDLVAEKDERLRKLMVEGKLTEDQARLARSFYCEPNDPAWTPPPRPELPRLAYYGNSRNYSEPEPEPTPAANGTDHKIAANEISLPAKTVLFSAPNSLYQINGRVYRGDWRGQIEAEAEDVPALVEAGCKRSRDPFGR